MCAVAVMASFTDDLFNVFEEEAEKPAGKPKKRRREGNVPPRSGKEEPKKARVDSPSTPKPSPVAESSRVEALEDESLEVVEGKEET